MAAKTSKSKPSAGKRPSSGKSKTKTAAKKAPKAAKKSVAKKKTAKKAAQKVAKPVAKKVGKKKVAGSTKKKATPKKKTVTKQKTTAKKAPAKKAPAKKAAKKAAKPAAKKAPKKAAKPAPKKAAKPAAKPATKKAAKPAAVKVAKPAAKKAVKKAAAPKKPAVQKVKVVKNPHKQAFINKQRQRLLDLRDELLDAMSGMTRDTIRNAPEGSEASGSGQHQGDAGSDAYDRDFALSVLAKEQDALYEIEQALRRVEIGTYGVCEMSMNKIPQMRLEAIPFARLTVECQAEWEKDYGNRRFRPSDEVGFSGGNQLDDEDSASVSLDDDD